jgi:hypothetical protein
MATGNCPSVVMDIINSNNPPPKCEIHGKGGSDKIKKEEKDGDSGW